MIRPLCKCTDGLGLTWYSSVPYIYGQRVTRSTIVNLARVPCALGTPGVISVLQQQQQQRYDTTFTATPRASKNIALLRVWPVPGPDLIGSIPP